MPVVVVIVVYASSGILIPFAIAWIFGLAAPAMPYFGLLLAGGITLLGLLCYWLSFTEASKKHDKAWMLDHFLAPLVATLFALIFVDQIVAFAWLIMRFDVAMANSGILGAFGSLALGIAGIAIVFGAPVLAVRAMMDKDRHYRLWSYAGFLVTASYYGVILIATITHRVLPSATM